MLKNFTLFLFLFVHGTFAISCKTGKAVCSEPEKCSIYEDYSGEYCGIHWLSDNYCYYTRPTPSCTNNPCDTSIGNCYSFMGCWSDSDDLKEFCENHGDGCYWNTIGIKPEWVSIRAYENPSIDFLLKKFRYVVVASITVMTA